MGRESLSKKTTKDAGVLETALKFGLSEEIEFVPVFTSSKQRRKNVFF